MRILVGAPTYNGQLTTQYARSLLELWGEIGAQAEWRTTKATLIAWARNVFASQVLEGDYSHLLFVDADIDFPARLVKRMLAFDQPVVSAVYPHRTLDVQAFYAQARRQPDPGAAMFPRGLCRSSAGRWSGCASPTLSCIAPPLAAMTPSRARLRCCSASRRLPTKTASP